jgi:hypothetical protein
MSQTESEIKAESQAVGAEEMAYQAAEYFAEELDAPYAPNPREMIADQLKNNKDCFLSRNADGDFEVSTNQPKGLSIKFSTRSLNDQSFGTEREEVANDALEKLLDAEAKGIAPEKEKKVRIAGVKTAGKVANSRKKVSKSKIEPSIGQTQSL